LDFDTFINDIFEFRKNKKILKMKLLVNLQTSTIGEIARINTNTIPIFRKYGIDFFCKGKNLLCEACAACGCNESAVLEELAAISSEINDNQNFNNWSISFLIEYIVENHHQYVNKTIPEISALFKEVSANPQVQNPDLTRVNELFRHLGNDMKQHMQKEELALFPLMKKLEALKVEGNQESASGLVSVQSLISVVEMEHDTSSIILKQISSLRNRVAESGQLKDNISALTDKLKEFESDLIMHIHIENNVLHPKAIELEQELMVTETNSNS